MSMKLEKNCGIFLFWYSPLFTSVRQGGKVWKLGCVEVILICGGFDYAPNPLTPNNKYPLPPPTTARPQPSYIEAWGDVRVLVDL